MKNQERKEAAFTLVELLLVVTIIGILAGAVMLNFAGQSQKAKISRASADISTIGMALSVYEIELGAYPASEEGLAALIEGERNYLQKSSYRDPWGSDYLYDYPGSHDNEYDLYSAGPDEQPGTEDDIGNWEAEDY